MTLEIILHDYLGAIWHNGCSGSLIGKGRAFTACSTAVSAKNARLELSGNSAENGEGFRGRGSEPKGTDLQEITKEVVGTHALLTRSLFGGSIPRRLLLRVSRVKLTSALLRFLWHRKTKPQFGSLRRPYP